MQFFFYAVYCKSCLDPTDEGLNCQVCQSPHPGQSPRVCLELDHFLEEKFSKEYSIRRELLHLSLVNHQIDKTTTSNDFYNLSSLQRLTFLRYIKC